MSSPEILASVELTSHTSTYPASDFAKPPLYPADISAQASDTKNAQDPKPTPSKLPFVQSKPLGQPVITIRHMSKSYKLIGSAEPVQALTDIHLADDSEFYPIRRGEFVILRGPSGGGKTTLLNCIGAIDAPTSGEIEILGDVVNEKSSDEFLSDLRLRKIGFVFQTFNLLATLSAFENVELPMIILGGMTTQQRKERVMKLLEMVGLQDRVSHLPSELSGGEQQRVAIARSLANNPEVLILDEATGDLDTYNTIEVMNLLLRINQEQQTTCLMVTHNPDIECYADRLLYLQDGKFKKQAVNTKQVPLNFDDYSAYLKFRDADKHEH